MRPDRLSQLQDLLSRLARAGQKLKQIHVEKLCHASNHYKLQASVSTVITNYAVSRQVFVGTKMAVSSSVTTQATIIISGRVALTIAYNRSHYLRGKHK